MSRRAGSGDQQRFRHSVRVEESASVVPFPRPDLADVGHPVGTALGSGMEARAERAIVTAVLAVRATFVVQLGLAICDGAAQAERPELFVGLGLAMVLESVLLAVFLMRRRAVTRTASLVDLWFIAVMILAEPLYSTPSV